MSPSAMSAAPVVEATSSTATVTRPFDNPTHPTARWLLAQGDRALVLAQRLGGLVTRAPEMDDDLAVANMAIDLIGQATMLYDHAGVVDGSGRNADDYAYWRDPDQFLSPRLVERPDIDFAHTIVRQFLHDAFATELWSAASAAIDPTIAAIAARAARETAYHLRYSAHWLVVLASGTPESRRRIDVALAALWPDTAGLFDSVADSTSLATADLPDAPDQRQGWLGRVRTVFADAGLAVPSSPTEAVGPRHDEGFDDLIRELQQLQREHPGVSW